MTFGTKMQILRACKVLLKRYKFYLSLYILASFIALRKLKALTRPFSDDFELMRMLPIAIFRVCKRRWLYGAVFPEWTFAFELIQCIMKCIADHHGEKLFTPPSNAVLFRQFENRITSPFNFVFCKMFKLIRQPVLVDNVRCEWVRPHVTTVNATNQYSVYVLLYLHGGGYVAMSPSSHLSMAHRLSTATSKYLKQSNEGDTTQVHVFFVDYRKSPEHVFPAALNDALAAFTYLTHGLKIPSQKIIVAGDSAGGGLTLSLLLTLRNQGREMPAAAICISPFVDLHVLDPDCEHDIISYRQVSAVKSAYVSESQDSELWKEASPMRNNLSNLPPLLIQAGDKEYLYQQCLRLAARAHADGTPTILDVHKNMPHVFVYFDYFVLPYSRIGTETIGKFAAHHFHRVTSPVPIVIRRNKSSCELGEKDCFVQPQYLSHIEPMRRVSSMATVA